MTQPGYIDYTRTSLATGFLLAGTSEPIEAGTVVFEGYVGAWPFINAFWNAVGGTDHYSIQLLYYSDNTFSVQVAQQISIRTGNIIGYRQYAVLSPWLQIVIMPATGGSATSIEFAFFGTTQKALATQLGSLDTQFYEQTTSIAAGGTLTTQILKIFPGRAIVTWFTGATAWTMIVQRYDMGSAAFQPFWEIGSGGVANDGQLELAMPDAPLQVVLHNSSSGTSGFNVYIMPMME